MIKAFAAKALVGLGLLAALGAAPAAQAYVWWKSALWIGGAIVGILLLVFLLSRGIKPSKEDDGPL
jgi:formate-dependent nitrite reductase membrane component NrfD